MLDSLKLGSSLLLRSHCRMDAFTSPLGVSRPDPPLPVLDFLHLGLLLPARSLVQPDVNLPVLDFLHPGSFLLLRDHFRLGASLPATAVSRFGLLAPVPDPIELGSAPSAHSPSHSEATVPVLGHTRPGFLLLLRSFSCPGFVLSALDFLHLGLLLLLRDVGQLGPSPSVSSRATCDSLSLALDFLQSGLVLLLRSYLWPEVSLPVPDFAHLGPPLPPRSFCCLEFMALVPGSTRPGSVSLPSATESTLLDPSMPPRSFGRVDSVLLALDFLHPGVLLPLQSLHCTEPTTSAFGEVCLGSSLPALDLTVPGPPLLLRSMARSGFMLLVPDSLQSDFSLLPRSFVQLGALLLATSSVHYELTLLALDPVHSGLVMSPHSLS